MSNYFKSYPITQAMPEDDRCEHVEANASLAHTLTREMDSFGPVGGYLCCEACEAKAQEEHDAMETTCHDCKKTILQRESWTWKWYDFYAAQGDEPLVLCDTCYRGPKHKARKAEDRAAYLEEMGCDKD